MRDLTALRDRFLEWLYEMAMGATDTFVPATEFFRGEAINSTEELQLARQWASEGLINNGSGLAGVSAALTHRGIEHVNALRQRRADPAQRRAAAVNGLLRWLYEVDPDGEGWTDVDKFLASPRSWFAGVQLTRAQVDRAAEHLKSAGLIDGSVVEEYRGPVNAQITAAGQECVEQGGDVADFLRRERGVTPAITTHIGTIHNTGALAVGSTNVTQNVAANMDLTAMAGFVQMMLRELSTLQMGADREAQAREALAEVQREVEQPDPDRGRVARTFGRFVEYLGDAGKPVLTAAFMLAAHHYGLPSS
ncbi:MAG TPA: hypothetical protein VFC00_28855 [Micromonosporaceae bacterium]|nr:hypothetical protein [Micromonosporaceae bacterium]